MKILTRKQRQVLDSIKEFINKNGFSPTLSELQESLNISTKRGVVQYLETLERKGYILRSSQSRGIRLVEQNNMELFMQIPILGFANAGDPVEFADENKMGDLQVEKALIPVGKDLFALKISGDSMNRRKIGNTYLETGNYAVTSKTQDFRDGDVVLAIIENCATIKTIKRTHDHIVLYPESKNEVHQPIFLNKDSDVFINGKVIYALENPMR